MLKTIQLTLTQIKYGGGSIGDDIRIELEVIGKFLRVDRQIKPGATANIDYEIGKFETDQKLFRANVFMTIIEKDLLFNDVVNAQGSIKVDTLTNKPQKFTFTAEAREKRSRFKKFWGKKIAIFEIALEAQIIDTERYVPDITESKVKGWLIAKLENDNSQKSLPAYLKVKTERIDVKREYFTILEGYYRGKSASIPLREDGSSWFISRIKHTSAVRITYSTSRKVITINGKRYKADDDPRNPWKKGLYDIELPDYPHQGGLRYPEAERGTVWFRIGHDGERYLHAGMVSAGCISITETNRWMEIYNILIKARKGDFMSVSVLEVID